MPAEVSVLAVCGSRRDESKTRVALETALESAADCGARTVMADLDAYELPPFDPGARAAGDGPRFRREVEAADAVLLGTPNYHDSYSGVLKNALDYCKREEFADTTVGLLEVAGGRYPGSAMADLRGVCRILEAWVLPTQVAVPRSQETVTGERIVDGEIRERVRDLGREVVAYAGVAGDRRTAGTARTDAD